MTVRMGETYVANGQLTQAGYSALRGTETAVEALQAADAALDARVDALEALSFGRSSSFATTSGGAVDITGVPTTAVAIDVHLYDVSLSGTDQILVQLLDGSGNPITTGYTSTGIVSFSANSVQSSSSTAGFIVRTGAAADAPTGTMTIRRVPGTQSWLASHTCRAQSIAVLSGGGFIAAGVNVTGVRLTRTGTNTFDNGSFFAEWRT